MVALRQSAIVSPASTPTLSYILKASLLQQCNKLFRLGADLVYVLGFLLILPSYLRGPGPILLVWCFQRQRILDNKIVTEQRLEQDLTVVTQFGPLVTLDRTIFVQGFPVVTSVELALYSRFVVGLEIDTLALHPMIVNDLAVSNEGSAAEAALGFLTWIWHG